MCCKHPIAAGFTVQRLSRRPFLGSIRSGTLCAPIPLSKNSVRKSSRESTRVKYWEIIADNLSKAGWSWGCVSTVHSSGANDLRAAAHRGDGKRFVVRADEELP